MSWAFTQVRAYGEHVTMRCEECAIIQPYTYIKDAQAAARSHNRLHHQRDRINPRHRQDEQ